jgi:hypothetical protein
LKIGFLFTIRIGFTVDNLKAIFAFLMLNLSLKNLNIKCKMERKIQSIFQITCKYLKLIFTKESLKKTRYPTKALEDL